MRQNKCRPPVAIPESPSMESGREMKLARKGCGWLSRDVNIAWMFDAPKAHRIQLQSIQGSLPLFNSSLVPRIVLMVVIARHNTRMGTELNLRGGGGGNPSRKWKLPWSKTDCFCGRLGGSNQLRGNAADCSRARGGRWRWQRGALACRYTRIGRVAGDTRRCSAPPSPLPSDTPSWSAPLWPAQTCTAWSPGVCNGCSNCRRSRWTCRTTGSRRAESTSPAELNPHSPVLNKADRSLMLIIHMIQITNRTSTLTRNPHFLFLANFQIWNEI